MKTKQAHTNNTLPLRVTLVLMSPNSPPPVHAFLK